MLVRNFTSRFISSGLTVKYITQPGVERVLVNAKFVGNIAGSLNKLDSIEFHFGGVFAARFSH